MPVEVNTLIAAAIDDGNVKPSAECFKKAIDLVASSFTVRMNDKYSNEGEKNTLLASHRGLELCDDR
jgi:hypothetical protein